MEKIFKKVICIVLYVSVLGVLRIYGQGVIVSAGLSTSRAASTEDVYNEFVFGQLFAQDYKGSISGNEGFIQVSKNSNTTSFEEHPIFQSISIYPNVTDQSINVDLPCDGVFEMQFHNINGQILERRGRVNCSNVVDMHTYESGIYFLKLSFEKSIRSYKIIKL